MNKYIIHWGGLIWKINHLRPVTPEPGLVKSLFEICKSRAALYICGHHQTLSQDK